MKYEVSIQGLEDGRFVARCADPPIEIYGDSYSDAQNKLGVELRKLQQAMSPLKDIPVTVELKPHEVDALKTVLRLVVDGRLDSILYDDEDEVDEDEQVDR